MAKDYRRAYEQHLGMLLPKEMHIHHIDHNRQNNCLSNLVAIPYDLHGRYHFLEREFQAHSSILIYRRPSQKTLRKYSYQSYVTGEWRAFFKGSESDFLDMANSYCGLVRSYEMYDAAKHAYLESQKMVLDYKKQQSNRA